MSEASIAHQSAAHMSRGAATPPPVAWFMGLATCVLTIGVIYWGVQLAQRDPNSLPVIRAPEGIARLEPTNPGGSQEEFTGLAVNSIQSGQPHEEEVIALAPQPTALSEEDIPALIELEGEAIEPVRVDIQELDGSEVATPATGNTEADTEVLMPVTAEEVATALAEALELANDMMDASDGEAVTTGQAETGGTPSEEDVDVASLIVADLLSELAESEESSSSSEEVPETSQTMAAVLESAEQTSASQPLRGPQEVASVESGTRLVQLGAFNSPEIARNMWTTLQGRNADLLAGRSYFIQPVESGGKTLFRLRVLGFETTAEARAMCAQLTERKTPCLAVIQR